MWNISVQNTTIDEVISILPFLKPKKQPSLIVAKVSADGHKEEMSHDGEENHGLMSAAEDLIRAVHAKDAHATVEALRSAFEIMELEPHDEAPHPEQEESES